MKYEWSVLKVLCAGLLLCASLAHDASAGQPVNRVVRFALCSINIKSIIPAEVPGSRTKWELVITLNRIGVREFRHLENKSPGQFVEVVWDGVSFGTRRLDLPIRSDAKQLLLGTRSLSRASAVARLNLLSKRLLHSKSTSPHCGALSQK